MNKVLVLWLSLMAPFLLQAEDLGSTLKSRALQVLQSGSSPLLASLADKDVLLLQATLALKSGEPARALDVLRPYAKGNDPLVDMLEAEAYRRSAIQAVANAGEYAKGLKLQHDYLQKADLSGGLREADVRLNVFLDRLNTSSAMPLNLLQVDTDIHSVFIVDKERSRMFVYARNGNGALKQVADEYVVTGAKIGDKYVRGDARTPNGVYRFVKRLQGRDLEARYGPVAYPIDYPNALDVLHHKDGSGIWMHGYAENIDRRPPQDTKGCFALPNERLLTVSKHVDVGKSLVLVGRNFVFNKPQERQILKDSVLKVVDAWRKNWSALNTEAYLNFYHKNFHSGNYDLSGWKHHKRRVNAHKSFVEVAISHLSLVRDNNMWSEGEVVVAEFDQRYQSNNYQDHSRKRLYLARLDKQTPWRILIEETVKP